MWGQAAVDQISWGTFDFAVLAALLWPSNRCVIADVGRVVALRQGCSEFALAQDKETKLIPLYKGE